MYLSIIIPAYNEQERIGATLQKIREYLSKQDYSYEVIVVSDGSHDRTSEIVNSFRGSLPTLKTMDNQKNRGKGFAIRCGLLEATGEFRLIMDADSSTDISEVEKLFPYFSQGYEMVIGSRRIEGARVLVDQSRFRVFLGWIFRHLVQFIVPLGVKDSQNGFKMFTAKVTEMVFPQQTIFRWAFDVEILALAKLFKFKIKEVPIVWVDSRLSKVTFGGMVRMLSDILIIRYNLWSNYYQSSFEKPSKKC